MIDETEPGAPSEWDEFDLVGGFLELPPSEAVISSVTINEIFGILGADLETDAGDQDDAAFDDLLLGAGSGDYELKLEPEGDVTLVDLGFGGLVKAVST